VTSKRLAWTPIAIGILIAILGSAFFLFRSREQAGLNGNWIARMQRPGHAAYMLRFRLDTSGTTLKGEVEGMPILTGSVGEKQVTFSTIEAKYQGEIRGREMHLTSTAPDGATLEGTARKTD
jgi:hypothetical protein